MTWLSSLRALLLMLLLLALLAPFAHRAGASAATVERISVGNGPMQHNGSENLDRCDVNRGAVSADGRFVAFTSDATNLVESGPTLGNAYVFDRVTGLTEALQPSVRRGPATMPALNRDGRYAAYVAKDPLSSGSIDQQQNIFVWDRQSGADEQVSVSTGGVAAVGNCAWPSLSADGRYVAFQSEDANLAPGDTNSGADVFVRDRLTGTTVRASLAGPGGSNTGTSGSPTISGDGRYVAFRSSSALANGDTNGADDIYLRDLALGTTERVSVATGGTQANGAALGIPVLSDDGRYVAFSSVATNLVAGDTNGIEDVFVRDRTTGTTERVSLNAAGGQSDHKSRRPDISADGRFVSFDSASIDLYPNVPPVSWNDIHVRDRLAGTTIVASVSDSGAAGSSLDWRSALSATGAFVAFVSFSTNFDAGEAKRRATVYLRDLQSGTTSRVQNAHDDPTQTDRLSYMPDMSADGRYVVFASEATNLVPGDTNGYIDIFLRDRVTNTIERVNVSSSGAQTASYSYRPSVSADGRYVCFESTDRNLAPGDPDGGSDIFRRDRLTGTTIRVSVADNGERGFGDSYSPWMSRDGRYIAFHSYADFGILDAANGYTDIFIRDVVTGDTELIGTGFPGLMADGNSYYPWISPNGRFVTFYSYASYFDFSDTNDEPDYFLWDRQSGRTERVNVASGGGQTRGVEWDRVPTSSDGRYVAFASDASNLVPGDTNGTADIFVRDRQTNTTQRVSIDTDGSQALGTCSTPAISDDGRFVVFSLNNQVWVRDRLGARLENVSLSITGDPVSGSSGSPAVRADARCIAFVSSAYALLGPSNLDTNGTQDIYLSEYNPTLGSPVATGQSLTASEDTPLPLTLTATDAEGDPLTYTILSPPQHGSLFGSGAARTYTPAPAYVGSDSFTFRVSDGVNLSNVATVSITVAAVNDPPLTVSDNYAGLEDTALVVDAASGLLGNDTDEEGSPLTAVLAGGPSHGAVTVNADGSFVYTPEPNYWGGDSFTYRASDGVTQSAPTSVGLTVTPIDDPTTALGQTVSTPEDTAVSVELTTVELDGNPLTYTLVTPPAHGVLSGSGASRTYTPAADYHGPDSFTFRVNDGQTDSNTATISLTVTPANDAPVATADTYQVNEDTELDVPAAQGVLANDTDVDGDALAATLVAQPAHGQLALRADGSFGYLPDADYSGSDGFTYQAGDGTANSATVAVSLTVVPVPDTPVAQGQSLSTPEDTARPVQLSATDADGDPLVYTVASGPAHGTLSGTAPNLLYTPEQNYHGTDTFTFQASDGTLTSTAALVSLTVTPVNDPPSAASQLVTTNEDTARGITLAGTDVDGDPLTYTIASMPARGALTGSGASRTYTPSPDLHGADSFTFRVSDGTVTSTAATVSITVTPVNDAPAALSQNVMVSEDAARPITLTATDVDGDPLTYTIVTGPTAGSLTGSGATRTYTPGGNFNGDDSFTFRVNDGRVNSNTATVTLSVSAVNDAPQGSPDSYSLDEDTTLTAAVSVLANDTDPDGDSLTAVAVAPPTHGTLVLTGSGSFSYTPASHYHGTDTFTYRAQDGQTGSAPVTVTLTIRSVNDPPVAQNVAVTGVEDTAKAVQLSASDVDGDTLTYQIVAAPAHGALSGTGATRSYQPSADFTGADTFTFKASDGSAESAVATVTVTVTGVNDAPVSAAQSVLTAEDTSQSITLAGTDADGDALTYSIVTGPAHGTLSGSGAQRTYLPASNYHGPDQFTFRVNDGAVNSSPATVSITVSPVNDPPVARAGADRVIEATGETTPVAVDASTSSDPDGDSLTYQWRVAGAVVGTGAKPNLPLPLGVHLVTLTVTDGQGVEGTDQLQVTVRDTTAPVLQLPSLAPVPMNAPDGARVTFAVSATDALPGVTVSTTFPSGSLFPLGLTTVSCRAQDAAGNEAFGEFQVQVVVPQNSAAKVTASGAIPVTGGSAKLKLSATLKPGKPLKGSLSFTDPATRQTYKTKVLTSLVVIGQRARVFGSVSVPGSGTLQFMADAEDLGTARGVDTFRLELSDGRVWGSAPLATGSVRITR